MMSWLAEMEVDAPALTTTLAGVNAAIPLGADNCA